MFQMDANKHLPLLGQLSETVRTSYTMHELQGMDLVSKVLQALLLSVHACTTVIRYSDTLNIVLILSSNALLNASFH